MHHALRHVLRFVASVCVTSGLLLLGDARGDPGLAEPISALFAQRAQDRLQRDLPDLRAQASADERRLAAVADPRARLVRWRSVQEVTRGRAGQ